MIRLSKKHNVNYFNYSVFNNSFKYSDGNHLEYESAKRFTEIILKDIREFQLNKKASL